MENLEILKNFDENSIPSLKRVVLGALELFSQGEESSLKFRDFKRPVVVGSGNAEVTAKILFEGQDVIFANENNIDDALKRNGVDGVFIFSASGAKHAPIIAKKALKRGLEAQLITCTKGSECEDVLGLENVIVTPKNREPYTYNTSTYLGWILAKTQENPKEIMDYILREVKDVVKYYDFDKFDSYLLLNPNEFGGLNNMFKTKFVELFGRNVGRDVFTYEQVKHAITVCPTDRELCIRFGESEDVINFDGKYLDIGVPKGAGIGTMMAIGYYVIGQIQEELPPYFQDNIQKYISNLNKTEFGRGLKVIVE